MMESSKRKKLIQGPVGIAQSGHREYVGGFWDRLGNLQYRFMLSAGLRPEHKLLDIGCGPLRAGRHFIEYLNRGCYFGIDKEPELIRLGIEEELDPAIRKAKQPTMIALSNFEFDRLPSKPDFALAQSVFTHLTPDDIHLCLANLRRVIADEGVFYATFTECNGAMANPRVSHSRLLFRYTRSEMIEMGNCACWAVDYLGKWNHPRGQRMLRFTPMRTNK